MTEIDSIIQKYLQGISSEAENRQLDQWLQLAPENRKRLYAEKDIWETIQFHQNKKQYEPAQELEILMQHVNTESTNKALSWRSILKIAAVLLITFGFGWSTQFVMKNSGSSVVEATLQEIVVPKGQINQVFLADGTRIWINSETKLTAPSVFGSSERVVQLSGEAFFEVAKDKKRPFRVKVNGQQIEVLGTSFNVRAYENSGKVETTLETGQIRLQTGNQTILLKPGDQSLLDRITNQLVVSQVKAENFSTWKQGRYEFQNEDLIEVFKMVERWYDVEIIADESYFKGMHFSGVIKRNKDATHFLQLLNLSVPIRYEIKADQIRISKK